MKIALIFTSLYLDKNWATLPVENEHMGVIPPLSLAYVAAICERAGHQVIIIDTIAERLTLDAVTKRLEDFSPDILGFTLTTYGFHQNLKYMRDLRKRINRPVIVGGWHLSLYPRESLTHQEIDYGVLDEGDVTIPELLNALEHKLPLVEVKGIAFRTPDGKVIVTEHRQPTQDIDSFPFPALHLLKNELYHNILSHRKNFTAMISALGCPFRCAFCDLKTKVFRQRSAKSFVDEIEIARHRFGVKDIDIHDSSFTVNRGRVMAICEDIIKRKLDVSFTIRTRADCVDKEVLRLLSEAGCSTIMYGIESGSPQILKLLHKGSDLEHIREVVQWTKKLGMKSLGFFMIGSPTETIQDVENTIRFSQSLDLDYVRFSRVTAVPNTELYDMYLKTVDKDYWAEYTLNPDNVGDLPMVQTNITDNEAYYYVKKAYISYYFRPSYLLKAVLRMRSWLEFTNSFKAGVDLLFSRHKK
ncbi:MAG: hypothetical protein A2234_04615 [Elusimicrobia bacterium RIFOXYA2_FULL_58_8]|nr:MAG: hypothetical protein A2285_10790 [Elusimicrobia bacterium RIFOXYA12_FULL_57_11]OGS13592.1 MAG: hypothetical protein A2234_04615 [Elusimicrobia bacterium RIFOXYA2_FULL_58_8]